MVLDIGLRAVATAALALALATASVANRPTISAAADSSPAQAKLAEDGCRETPGLCGDRDPDMLQTDETPLLQLTRGAERVAGGESDGHSNAALAQQTAAARKEGDGVADAANHQSADGQVGPQVSPTKEYHYSWNNMNVTVKATTVLIPNNIVLQKNFSDMPKPLPANVRRALGTILAKFRGALSAANIRKALSLKASESAAANKTR